MCRIAGIYRFSQDINDFDMDSIKKASIKLEKGGPDNEGIYRNGHVALLHRRLSIIDTSDAGNQPFFDSSKKYCIVFNGEIFNFLELKKQKLDILGLTFQSSSDTEVLLYLLINYGTACIEWLSGFFSFGFYDIERDNLVLARDKFGKKPLLYYQDEGKIIFASEMKALFCFDIKKEINFEALQTYLELTYIPQNASILKNVKKIPAGTYISICNKQISSHQYYNLKLDSDNYALYSYEEAQKKLVNLMHGAVERRMISDVPLGAFLSGGIDSSVVVALASAFTTKLQTFSIGYKDNPIFDETHYAQLVAKKYNTNHHVFYLEQKDFSDVVFNVLDYIDEPFADSSAIPVYILCMNTKKHVTVSLSGDGGDEVFGGYNKHKAEWDIRNNKSLALLAKVISPVFYLLPNHKNSKIGNFNRQFQKFNDGAKLQAKDRYIKWGSISSENKLSSPLSHAYSSDGILEPYKKLISAEDFNSVLMADIKLGLVSDMLHKVDMMSMANSMEVRSPFLDPEVVDFAFKLPSNYKLNKSLKKRIVQDAFRHFLPPELYNRPKQGFEIPLDNWFKNELHDYIFNELLNKNFIEEQQIFSYEKIMELKLKLLSNSPANVAATIWSIVVFQHWYKKYII
jgi:asparagine synthase (glutamine-hydrolysing)